MVVEAGRDGWIPQMDVCQSSRRPLNSQQQAGTTAAAETTASNQAELSGHTTPEQKDLAENVWRSECSEMMRLPFSRTTQACRYHASLRAMHSNVLSSLYQHEFGNRWCSSASTFSSESWPLKLEKLPSQARLLTDGGLATSVLSRVISSTSTSLNLSGTTSMIRRWI